MAGVTVVPHENGEEMRHGGNFPSAGDPDVLRDLVQQSRGVPADVQRITGTEIKSLRTTSQTAAAVNVSMTRGFMGFFASLFGGLFALFAPPTKKRSQCDMYGHLRPSGGWS